MTDNNRGKSGRSRKTQLTLQTLESRDVPTALLTSYELGGISGYVYTDNNCNGVRDYGDCAIPGATVTLTGKDNCGNSVNLVATTNADGQYSFCSLKAGTYTLTETQPAGYTQGTNSVGSLGGFVVPGTDQIQCIVLCPGDKGYDYNFGEKKEAPRGGTEGLTPGFWKQSQHFKFWVGYKPTDSFESVFGVDLPGGDVTLLQALSTGGGGHLALNRHAVAALLNGSNSNVDYAYSSSDVIDLVQQAYATLNFESVKNVLEAENQKGADLKR